MKDLSHLRARSLSLLCAFCLLTSIVLLSSFGAEAEQEEDYYPYNVSVTYGTASGSLSDVVGQDYVYYSVVEEDINSGTIEDIQTLNPSGTGTYNEWTTGVGPGFPCSGADHWGCTDEGPPSPGDSDTTYVQDLNILGHTDTYELEDYILTAGASIDGVELYVTALSVFSVNVAATIYSGTTLAYGPDVSLITSYYEFSHAWSLNPDDAEAWEDADIDALEAGCERTDVSAMDEVRMTLVYIKVTASGTLDDYRVLFDFDFSSLDLRNNPRLEISGYRDGDSEAIAVQVLRDGSWTALTSDAFGSTLSTERYSLSALDVMDGSARVRIVDTDTTDDTATTVYIDDIFIIGSGKPDSPMHPIRVYTATEYNGLLNRLEVSLWWMQIGGPEPAKESTRYLEVYIDGVNSPKGYYPARGNETIVPVTWNILDASAHNVTIIGWVVIEWSHGTIAYSSDGENLRVDNLLRFMIIVILFILLIAVFVVWGVASARNRAEDDRRASKET